MLNNYEKNKRNYSSIFGSIMNGATGNQSSDKETGAANTGKIHQIHQKVEQANAKPSWPDGGMNMPSTLDDDNDDQNAWGGLDILGPLASRELTAEDVAELFSSADSEDIKYGPGNYPDDNDLSALKYKTTEFFHNLLAEDKLKYTWIVPGVLAAGPHPFFVLHQDNLSEFKKAGFKAIVSICEKPLEPKYIEGFHYHFSTTLQCNDLNKICEFIDTQEELENPVYIHSFDGKSRAAVVLVAYLVHMSYLTAEEAINYIKQHYDKAFITVEQEKIIFDFTQQS